MEHGSRYADTQALRDQLVGKLRAGDDVRSERVAQAFRAVPRHVFLPHLEPEQAYRDEAFPIKYGSDARPISSSSQPAIMARMLEQLDVEPGHRVLEIGAGTGYNAALLAYLVGETGSVVTVDIDADLVAGAREHLAAYGLSTVTVAHGDGGLGWPQQAPYDRIILTVGAWDLPSAWTQQLVPTGRLLVPLDLRGVQRSIAFEPAGERLDSVSIVDCGFMRMRGALTGPEAIYPLGPEPGLFVELAEQRRLDADALYAALTEPGKHVASGVRVTLSDIWGGLGLWLALQEPELARLLTIGAAADRGLVPALIAFPGQAGTVALLGAHALAALVRLPDDERHRADSFALAARPFGPDGRPLAERLVAHIRAWDAHQRPSSPGLRISAYPRHADDIAADTIIDKHHIRLGLNWRRFSN
ncbi:MAG: methyltransferase, FxLD system [Pseudonocardiaceae bacterium]